MWYVTIVVICGVWAFLDATKRRGSPVIAALSMILLAPVALPIYLGKRRLLPGEVRTGGSGWNIAKYFALSWTVLMAIAVMAGLSNVAQHVKDLDSDAEFAGAAIGASIGLGVYFFLWLFPVLGALALGLFARNPALIERAPLTDQTLQETQP